MGAIKTCKKCGCEKQPAEFHAEKKARDGRSGTCKQCWHARTLAWRAANPERIQEMRRAHTAAYVGRNREAVRASERTRYQIDIEASRAKVRESHRRNPESLAATNARRVRATRLATPTWADRKAIRAFYEQAAALSRSTGVKHHVDHIVPLRSKLVSGLHVEANLAVVTGRENLSKSNRFWPDMP